MRLGSLPGGAVEEGNQSSYTVVEAVGPSLTSQLGWTSTPSPAAMCSRLYGILVGRGIGKSEVFPDKSRSYLSFPGSLVYHKVVLGGPCAETSSLRARHYPSTCRDWTRQRQAFGLWVSHSVPNTIHRTYARAPSGRMGGSAVGSWRAEKEKKVKEKQLRHMHWRWAQMGLARGQSSPESLIALCEMRFLCLLQSALQYALQYAPWSRPLGRHTPSDAIERLSIVGVVQGG